MLQEKWNQKVNEWISTIQCLVTIAVTLPHAAFSVLIHRLMSKWAYLSRTIQISAPCWDCLMTHCVQFCADNLCPQTALCASNIARPPRVVDIYKNMPSYLIKSSTLRKKTLLLLSRQTNQHFMLGTYDFSHITMFLSTWGVIFYTVNLLYFNKSLLVSMQMGIKYMTCIFLYIIKHYTPSGKKKIK